MRRCAVKTLLTHSRRIHWVLLIFVQVYYIFFWNAKRNIYELLHAFWLHHAVTAQRKMTSFYRRNVYFGLTSLLTRVLINIVCQKLTNVVHLFVNTCSVTAPHDVVRSIAISISVCLSARISQKPRVQTSCNLLCMLRVAVAWSFYDDNAIRYYTLCIRKKQDTKLLPITSPNVNRFSKFFHC